MKIKTRKNKSYPGDNSILVYLKRDNGGELGLFNLYPNTYRTGRYYDNDRYTNVFKTIKEAKKFALTIIDKEFKE